MISKEEEQHAPAWLIPLILLKGLFARFSRALAWLKLQRRTRPMPLAWRHNYPGLRQCEWHVHQLVANGARQILATGSVDLRSIPMILEPEEDFICPFPKSAFAMALRLEAIARFHSRPDIYMRRHADRIRQAEDRRTTDPLADLRGDPADSIAANSGSPLPAAGAFAPAPAAQRIRAPP